MQPLVLGVFVACALLSAGLTNGANFETTAPFHGQKYADIGRPRGMLVDDAGDVLVVAQGANAIIALIETENSNGTVAVEQITIVNAAGLRLNHGIAYFNGFLYASSSTDVYRWPYQPGQQTIVTAPAQTVIRNIPGGGHNTRTLEFNTQGMLYISVGSNGNVDQNSDRARIRSFNMNQGIPTDGIEFIFGGLFADGLRNEVGLAFDANGTLWGVENGADQLNRPDLGGDIHNGNPAEELNKFDRDIGQHYGYPYCFSTHVLQEYEAGTQFAWPSFMNDGIHTDAWCRNTANNQPPTLAMPAHNAPLGIEFYDGTGCDSAAGAFPCSAIGDAFVAFHGSWNSDTRVGYRVGWLKFENGNPTGENVDVIFEPNKQSCGDCFRPVNAVFTKNGHLIVSADDSNEIFKVTYNTPPRATIN